MQGIERLLAPKSRDPLVFEVKSLRDFIEDYPYEELRPQLREIQKVYQYYRPIFGDGNCFYRSCIFLYLSQARLHLFDETFRLDVDLFKCKNLTFKNELNWSSQQYMFYIWEKYFKDLAKYKPNERETYLQHIFNSSEHLDCILIAYFRVMTYEYIKHNQEEFQGYVDESFNDRLSKILRFKQQTETLQVYSMSKCLNIRIDLFAVHEKMCTIFSYNERADKKIVLFYRPGHYEILCNEGQYNENKSAIKSFFFRNSTPSDDTSQLNVKKYHVRTSTDMKDIEKQISKAAEVKQIKQPQSRIKRQAAPKNINSFQKDREEDSRKYQDRKRSSPTSLKSEVPPSKTSEIPWKDAKGSQIRLSSYEESRKSKNIYFEALMILSIILLSALGFATI